MDERVVGFAASSAPLISAAERGAADEIGGPLERPTAIAVMPTARRLLHVRRHCMRQLPAAAAAAAVGRRACVENPDPSITDRRRLDSSPVERREVESTAARAPVCD